VGVVTGDVAFDTRDEFFDITERATFNSVLGNQPEPTFDLIEPGRIRGGREVDMEAGPFRKLSKITDLIDVIYKS